MGLRGPPKTPAAIKLAHGTFRKDRDGDPAAQPQAPPASLGKAPEALGDLGKRVWDEAGPKLVTAGTLTVLDVAPFTRYCRAHDEVARLDAILGEHGEYFTTEQGYVGQHPAVNQRFKWLAELNRFESRFGMTASDRCGIQLPGKGKNAVPTRARA